MKMKVFMTCALGAFVGAMVARQFNHYFWWVGMLAGYATCYFTFEVETVVAAAQKAWKMSWTETKERLNKVRTWNPCWKVIWLQTQTCFLALVMFTMGCAVLWLSFWPNKVQGYILDNRYGIGLYWLFCWSFLIVVGIITFWRSLKAPSERDTAEEKIKIMQRLRSSTFASLLLLNPIGLPCVFVIGAVVAIVVGLYILIKHIIGGLLWNFARYLFKMIHSDARLLCSTDAALGATLGYFAHNPLVGAIGGGLLGVLHYALASKLSPKLVHTPA